MHIEHYFLEKWQKVVSDLFPWYISFHSQPLSFDKSLEKMTCILAQLGPREKLTDVTV